MEVGIKAKGGRKRRALRWTERYGGRPNRKKAGGRWT
jgi:hypothetical protein